MNLRPLKSVLFLTLFILFSFFKGNFSYAEDKVNNEIIFSSNCSVELKKKYNELNTMLLEKNDKLFKTTKPSSSLINESLRNYRSFEKSVFSEFNKVTPNSSDTDYLNQLENYRICTSERDEQLSKTKEFMLNHIKKNAAQKKSARLIEKLKQVNNKMQGYDSYVTQFYKLLLQFNNKLPNFVTKCITASK